MITNSKKVQKVILSVSAVLSVISVVLKQIIESTMIATSDTTTVSADVLILISSILLIVRPTINSRAKQTILLLAMILLAIKVCAGGGSITTLILYVLIIISNFKPVQQKTINTAIIVDLCITPIITIVFVIQSIIHYGSFYYASPHVIYYIASLISSIGVWIIFFTPVPKTVATTPTITCPYCKSTDCKKITATAKAVNIALFGIFGNKRRYQWHCDHCGSDF